MKSRLKLAPIAIVVLIAVGLIAMVLIFRNNTNDAASPTISPELREVLTKSGPNELIKVWVEFDPDEYANKTGTRIVPLVERYKIAAVEKMRSNAFDKFLPGEIIALIYCTAYYSKAVAPPIELEEKQFYLTWYTVQLTPTMIESIAGFPGIQKITLFKLPTEIPKVDPILISYIEKVAEEYPGNKITLHIELSMYKRAGEIVERYKGSMTYSRGAYMDVVALPNIQLVMELASLPEVSRIFPTRSYYAG
jgi:hypothetical protein